MRHVEMGMYYTNSDKRVKTVCRAKDIESSVQYIAYVEIYDGGCVSEVYLMREDKFKSLFLK